MKRWRSRKNSIQNEIHLHGAAIIPLAVVLSSILLLIIPLWTQPGLPLTADGIVHLHRIAAIQRAHDTGLIWPRWLPDSYCGLGAATFHYYASGFYQIVSFLSGQGFALDTSVKWILSLAYVISGFALYTFLRDVSGPAAGITAGLIYLSQPAFYREFYFQGNYPQWFTLLWLPVVFYASGRLYHRSGWLDWILATGSLYIMIISHNSAALLGAFALAIFWPLVSLTGDRKGSGLKRLIIAGFLGLGWSAFYWLPAIIDIPYVLLDRATQGAFSYTYHFVEIAELLSPPPVLDGRSGNPPFPHMLGWLVVISVGGSAIVLTRNLLMGQKMEELQRGIMVASWIMTTVFLFLALPWSRPVWEIVKILHWLQFPARFLAPAILGIAIVAGITLGSLVEKQQFWALVFLLCCTFVFSVSFLFPRQPFARFISFENTDMQEFEEAHSLWGLTPSHEYLPRWATITLSTDIEAIRGLRTSLSADFSWANPHKFSIFSEGSQELPPGLFSIPVHYFPSWRAMAAQRTLNIYPNSQGFITTQLPPGITKIEVAWKGTTAEKIAKWLSRISILGLLTILLLIRRYGASTATAPMDTTGVNIRISSCLYLKVFLFSVAILIIWWLLWQTPHNPFRITSPPDIVYGVENPRDIVIGGDRQPSIIFRGWDLLSGKAPRPGDEIVVRLYWDTIRPISQNFDSFVHLYSPELNKSWVIGKYRKVFRYPTSKWVPGLYYIDEIVLTLPLDLPPLTYTLVAGMTNPQGQRLEVPGNENGLIFLDKIMIEPLPAHRLSLLQPYIRAEAIFDSTLKLEGYNLLASPGGPILKLYWHPLQKSERDWKVFIHLIDPQQAIIAQYDSFPVEGLYPTSQWQPDTIIVDSKKLWLPDEKMIPGRYTIAIGLYNPITGTRARVQPEPSFERYFVKDALLITFDVP